MKRGLRSGKKNEPSPSFNWDEIDTLRRPHVSGERPGSEWFTRVEFQSKFDLPRPTAESQLQRMVEAEELETVKLGSSRFYRVRERNE